MRYVEELQSYRNVEAVLLAEFFLSLLLWRGHYPCNVSFPTYRKRSDASDDGFFKRWSIKSTQVMIPARSMVSFAWGIAITRNFELFPSFFVCMLGWSMTACLSIQRAHPDPWKRPRKFPDLMSVLLWNKTPEQPPIEAYENQEVIDEYQRTEEARKEAVRVTMESLYEEQQKMGIGTFSKEMLDTEAEDLDQDFGTKAKGNVADLPLAPFKNTLLPVQVRMYKICVQLRIIRSILLWRDSYISFFVVLSSAIGAFLLALIPWTFVLKTSFTIAAWVFLGPWMKLVDIYYYTPMQAKSAPNSDVSEKFKAKYKKLLGQSLKQRLEKEAALKNEDMRSYMFGKVSLRADHISFYTLLIPLPDDCLTLLLFFFFILIVVYNACTNI